MYRRREYLRGISDFEETGSSVEDWRWLAGAVAGDAVTGGTKGHISHDG